MKPAIGLQRRAGAILAIDVLALAAVLATAPAAFVWLDGSRPSPLAVDSSGSGSGSAHSPGPTPSVSGVATQAPVQTARPATAVPTTKIVYGDGTWDSLPPMPRSLWGAASAVLADGRVLVIGGLSGPNSA